MRSLWIITKGLEKAKEIFISKMNKKQIVTHLTKTPLNVLCEESDFITGKYLTDKVYIRGLVEFSNYCVRDCLYCGLRKNNKKISRYRMAYDEIISSVKSIIKNKIKTIVLQSGDDFYYTEKMICAIIESIKDIDKDIAVTLSIGERPLYEYLAFRKSGADRFLIKHETINSRIYNKLHPQQDLKKRLKIIGYLRKIGFQVGVGNIIGLPGQTIEDLADDILFMQDFKPDMIGIGPFIAQKDTPLRKNEFKNIPLVLRFIALSRIITKYAHIPATTAMATLKKDGQLSALKFGANVIMVDFTPVKFSQEYRIYDNKIRINLKKAENIISKSGRIISYDRGDSLMKGADHGRF